MSNIYPSRRYMLKTMQKRISRFCAFVFKVKDIVKLKKINYWLLAKLPGLALENSVSDPDPVGSVSFGRIRIRIRKR